MLSWHHVSLHVLPCHAMLVTSSDKTRHLCQFRPCVALLLGFPVLGVARTTCAHLPDVHFKTVSAASHMSLHAVLSLAVQIVVLVCSSLNHTIYVITHCACWVTSRVCNSVTKSLLAPSCRGLCRDSRTPPALGSSRHSGGGNPEAPGSRRGSQEALWGRLSSQEALGSASRQGILGRLTNLPGSRRTSTESPGLPSRAPALGTAGKRGSFFMPDMPRCVLQITVCATLYKAETIICCRKSGTCGFESLHVDDRLPECYRQSEACI